MRAGSVTACADTACEGTACADTACEGTACADTACEGTACAVTACEGTACAVTACADTACEGTACAVTACAVTACEGTACADTACEGTADKDLGARGLVARILPSSAVDGPGNRGVIFLQGCDFDCRYCHNPETRSACVNCGLCVGACSTSALEVQEKGVRWDLSRCVDCGACIAVCPHSSSPKARFLTVAEVLTRLDRYRPFLRGITVSGGECGLQADFLEALLRSSASVGLPGMVDTNGSTDYAALPGLTAAAEGFMLDVKAWDEGEHRALTGSGNRVVLANLRFLAGKGKLYEARTVVAPGLFDIHTTVRETARVLGSTGSAARYKLIRFRPQGVRSPYRDVSDPGDGLMAELEKLARGEGAAEVVLV